MIASLPSFSHKDWKIQRLPVLFKGDTWIALPAQNWESFRMLFGDWHNPIHRTLVLYVLEFLWSDMCPSRIDQAIVNRPFLTFMMQIWKISGWASKGINHIKVWGFFPPFCRNKASYISIYCISKYMSIRMFLHNRSWEKYWNTLVVE